MDSFSKTHANLRIYSRRKNGALTELYQLKPLYSSPGKGTPTANLPHSKAGRAWRRSARKLCWDGAGTLGSETRAVLPRRCRPALARTSRSNSFECQAAAAGHGDPPISWGPNQPRSASQRRCAQGVLWGWVGASGPRRTCWRRDSSSVFTCGRCQQRWSSSLPLAGQALTRRWRSEHEVELAPQVAGRASFTARWGGEGAERERGSCDRRLAKYPPSTADFCACAPWSALSPHFSPAGRGRCQPGRWRGPRLQLRSRRWEVFPRAQPQ